MGRVRLLYFYGYWKFIIMFDGVIFIFDFFEFLVEYCVGDDIIMVICFGIVNYSEK